LREVQTTTPVIAMASEARSAEQAFRAEVRAFLAAALPDAVRDKVRDGRHPTRAELGQWQKTLAAPGWLVPHWPKEHGGPGWTLMQRWILDEEYHATFCLISTEILGQIWPRNDGKPDQLNEPGGFLIQRVPPTGGWH